jgi:hypothetical protein
LAKASSQMWMMEVLPRPVGKLHDEGKSPSMKRVYKADCQGKGAFPINFVKAAAKSSWLISPTLQ